ncbi:MAG: acyl-CoA dehydrogenase [Actinobacteria bacterium]|nr:MAG: acyl-CoA dehydrogenase [Actinomycetota bacterium]
MNLRDSPDEEAFRARVRAWLAENLPAEGGREWSRKLFDAGYAGLTWPVDYGGLGAPYSHQAIALEEFARAEAPNHMNVIALGMAGPTIMAHGTEEQKRRYLPKMLSAEEIWCQGFSEPDAGSDLSAVRTRIEPTDGGFLVNGQKVWSSLAHDADEIFFTDVEVPGENLLGEIGGGWQVAMTTLLHERGTLGFALTGTLDALVNKLITLTKERAADDPIIRDRVAQEWIELQALKLTNYRSLTTLMQTGIPGPEGSGSKLHWSEQNQRLTKLAMEILGGEDDGYWRYQQLRSRGNTIEAGTSEILRNIIAERVLGLPRSR